MLDGLDEALDGLSAGESTTFETTLVGGEHAGEQAQVTITATAVKERDLPPVDDDFAQMASEHETIDELRAELKAEVAEMKQARQAMDARDKLMKALEADTEVPVPQAAIDRVVEAHLEQESRQDDTAHRAEVAAEAAEALRNQIILDTLAEQLEIKVSQPELIDYLVNMSSQYRMEPQQFIEAVGQSGQIPAMVADVARSKAAAHALRRVTIKDTAGQPVDLSDVIGDEASDAEQAAAEQAMFEQVSAMAEQAQADTLAGESGEGSNEELPESAANPAAIPEL